MPITKIIYSECLIKKWLVEQLKCVGLNRN